jgi:hypothetical protein
VGIDPGLTLTGVAILSPNKVLKACEVFSSIPPGEISTWTRINSFALDIHAFVGAQIAGRPFIFVIELPIYIKNAITYAKQVRLVQEIMSSLITCGCGTGYLDKCYGYIEVLPQGPRIALGLSASCPKAMITELFQVEYPSFAEGNKARREALGDAWAIAQCAWGPERAIYESAVMEAE